MKSAFPLVKMNKLVDKASTPVEVEPDSEYVQIGIRSHGKGLFDKGAVSGRALGDKRVFWVEPDCFVVNIVFAWEQAIGKTGYADVGKIASHRFPMYRPKPGKADVDYLVYLFKTRLGKHLLTLASPGGAGRNKTLGQIEFSRIEIPCPPLAEQKRIAEILSTWDRAIETTEKLIANSESQKKALMQQLLTGKKRLPGFSGEWKPKKLKALIEVVYGTSPKGIEKQGGQFPIIGTGGVVGQTDQITHDKPSIVIGRKGTIDKPQFVQGAFWAIDTTYFCKAKACDLRWLYQVFTTIDWRRYNEASGVPSLSRSTIYSISVLTPPEEEQIAIRSFLERADAEITRQTLQLKKLRCEKSALMQQLLTGKRRVKIKGEAQAA